MIHRHNRNDTYSTQGIGLILLLIATALGLLRAMGLLVS